MRRPSLIFAFFGALLFAEVPPARAHNCLDPLAWLLGAPKRKTPASTQAGPGHAFEEVDEMGLASVRVTRNTGTMLYTRTNRGVEGLQKLYGAEMLRVSELKGKRVLDAGTGDGQFVRDLRAQGVEASGLDIHLSAEQLAEPELFVKADMAHMPFTSESFDVIYSSLSVFFYEPRNEALLKGVLQEFRRVLKAGGVARIGTYYGSPRELQAIVQQVPGLEIRTHRRTEHGSLVEIRRKR